MPSSVKMSDVSVGSEDEGWCEEASEVESYGSDASETSMGLAGGHGDSTSCSGAEGWTVVDTLTIRRLQTNAVNCIKSILGCKSSIAKSLLMHYRWDKEALSSVLAEQGPEHVYKVAGVADVGNEEEAGPSGSAGGAAPVPAACLVSCQTCFCEVNGDGCTAMGCGHVFCNDCWVSHFTAQIGDGHARNLRCMAFRCGITCDEDKVLALLAIDKQLKQKYEHALLQSYMEDNNSVRFCPSAPWCGRAVQVEGDPFCEPECSCGVVFCFKCGKSPHSPTTCAMWDKWDEKICGDSETRNWMVANTKPCPKCSKSVEKNGGCNHVVCKCGQAFCWLCGVGTGMAHSWNTIDGHQCGRWREELDRQIDEAAKNHKRYMHYFERFKLHGDSHRKESLKRNYQQALRTNQGLPHLERVGQQLEGCPPTGPRSELLKKTEMQLENGVEARDYSWLVRALDQLKIARSVLANTYAFAYFFFGNDMYREDFTPEENARNQNLFEDHQQMLESEVERLSGLVAKCSESLTLDPQERVRVINSTVNIEQRIIKLYDLVENDCYGRLQTCSAQIAVYKPKRMT